MKERNHILGFTYYVYFIYKKNIKFIPKPYTLKRKQVLNIFKFVVNKKYNYFSMFDRNDEKQ